MSSAKRSTFMSCRFSKKRAFFFLVVALTGTWIWLLWNDISLSFNRFAIHYSQRLALAPDVTGTPYEDLCAYRTIHGKVDPHQVAPVSEQRIPKHVHFIFGLDDNTEDDYAQYSFVHYMIAKAASKSIRPDKLFFHYYREPAGQWWQKAISLPNAVKHAIQPIRSFMGRPIHNSSHQSDVIRLQVLKEFGGIYLDADTIVFRSLDPLLHNEAVMGRQGKNYGLCNAFMMFSPNSTFLQSLLDSYATFNPDQWDQHSVRLPLWMARHPKQHGDVCMLHRMAVHYPMYLSAHVYLVMTEEVYNFDNDYQYAYHLSQHIAYPFGFHRWTAADLRQRDSSLKRLLAQFLDPTD